MTYLPVAKVMSALPPGLTYVDRMITVLYTYYGNPSLVCGPLAGTADGAVAVAAGR